MPSGIARVILRRRGALSPRIYIVLQKLNTINAGNGNNRITLIIGGTFAVARFYNSELAVQYLRKKISITTSRFEKTAVNTFGLLFYKVEHGIDFTLSGKNLSMIGYTLL